MAQHTADGTRHSSGGLQGLIRTGVIVVSVLGAVPTAVTLYQSYKHGIPYSQVNHRLDQYNIWTRNADCKIDYRELKGSQGARINVGACPKTGDINIRVAAANGSTRYEWIAFDRVGSDVPGFSVWDLLISPVKADQRDSKGAPVRIAQAQTMTVVCESMPSKSSIVRIVNEGGKCFRETISPFKGRLTERKEVPCNTACPPAGK